MNDDSLGYLLYTQDDPIEYLKKMSKSLPFWKKRQLAPYVRGAEHFVRKSQRFRDYILRDNDPVAEIIGVAWGMYFDQKLFKGHLMVIPRDTTAEFIVFMSGFKVGSNPLVSDKYLKKTQRLIASYNNSIESFVRAFHSLDVAGEKCMSLQK